MFKKNNKNSIKSNIKVNIKNYLMDLICGLKYDLFFVLIFDILILLIDYCNIISRTFKITLTNEIYIFLLIIIISLFLLYLIQIDSIKSIVSKRKNYFDQVLINTFVFSFIYSLFNYFILNKNFNIFFIIFVLCLVFLFVRMIIVSSFVKYDRKTNIISCIDLYENNIKTSKDTKDTKETNEADGTKDARTAEITKPTLLIKDEPLTNSKDDLIDYSETIKSIYNYCVNVYSDKSFVIGIIGKWGSGKTSLINLVKEELEKEEELKEEDKVIILKFSPWEYPTIETMLNGLCNQIVKSFKHSANYLQLEISMNKYKKILIDNFNKLLNIDLNNLFGEDAMIDKLKSEINSLLNDLGSHFVIAIDDFDRLDEDELLFLAKSINSLLNFDNIKYIICYDESNLNKISLYDDNYLNRYFEKVIKGKIYVPSIDRVSFNSLFYNLTTNLLGYYSINIIEDMEADYKAIIGLIANDLSSMRDCIRFLNSLSLNINTCIDLKLYIPDFIALEYIKYQNSYLYEEIYTNIDLFLNYGKDNDKISNIVLKNNITNIQEKILFDELFYNSTFKNPKDQRCKDRKFVYSYFSNKNNVYTKLNFEIDELIEEYNAGINAKEKLDLIINNYLNLYNFIELFSYKIEKINDKYGFINLLLKYNDTFVKLVVEMLNLDVKKSIKYINDKLNNIKSVNILFGIIRYYDNNGWNLETETIKIKCESILENLSKRILKDNVDLFDSKYDLRTYLAIGGYINEQEFKTYVTSILSPKNVMRILASSLTVSSSSSIVIQYDKGKCSRIVDIDKFEALLNNINKAKLKGIERSVYSAYKNGETEVKKDTNINFELVRYKDISKKTKTEKK